MHDDSNTAGAAPLEALWERPHVDAALRFLAQTIKSSMGLTELHSTLTFAEVRPYLHTMSLRQVLTPAGVRPEVLATRAPTAKAPLRVGRKSGLGGAHKTSSGGNRPSSRRPRLRTAARPSETSWRS